MGEEPAMTWVACVKHDLSTPYQEQLACNDCHYEMTLPQTKACENAYIKRGFYAGQAMAGVELDDCHENWKKWNTGGITDEL